jgi:serine/threonine protein kinase/Tol biopolymer transport system component
MPLAPGTNLGPYEVLGLLGAGGMGEVYRARDPRVGRDVAIKISAVQFNERFDREVRAVASLNHPNICHLYDVGPNYLVMELVEGESPKGPLPADEALRIARQIGDALEEAHGKGIIHRDLKPANIKITPAGTVKVLDFGLAKIADAPETQSENSPTLSMAATQAGVILGTAAYMSPEQARGKKVDKRADIWAFGVVLYEMLTGDRLFGGDTIADTLIDVATRQPDWEQVPADLLPLLRKCLEKDPKKRLRDIGDMDLLLAAAPSSASPASESGGTRWIWPIAAAVAMLIAAILAFLHFREQPPVAELQRFQIPAPEKTTFNNYLGLSPDGRKLAFTTGGEGGNQLWVRSLDTLQARVVAPWNQNPVPFWSPDSRFIAFQQEGKLRKVDVAGGPPTTLCDAPTAFGGGAWSKDGVIVFGDRAGRLMQVSAGGGVPTPLTNLDQASQETSHALPSFLPDGKHFLYLRRSSSAEKTGVFIGSVDTKPEQQDSRLLLATSAAAVYTPADSKEHGYLLFLRDNTLMAQPFDAARLALAGEPAPVPGAEHIGTTTYGFGRFTASFNGALAYSIGNEGGSTQLTWFDRQGKTLETIGQRGSYNTLALSPDGTRVAAERREGNGSDLWLIESKSGGKSDRFTFDPGTETAPVWSPDGSRLVYASTRGGGLNLYQKLSNLAGNEEELFKSSETKYPTDWSRDRRFLLFTAVGRKTQGDLWSLTMEGEHKATAFLQTEFQEFGGKLSPDGHWLAYVSNVSGQNEVYVRPFPASADRTGQWLVSNGGGSNPLWRRDGKELFYRRAQGVMAVEVTPGAVFKSGQPKQLFPVQFAAIQGFGYNLDVTADGQRFLINTTGGDNTAQEPITLVLNWTAGLRK